MMKSKFCVRSGSVALGVFLSVACVGFTAFGETLVWSGQVDYSADTTITDDIELDGTVTVNVTKGKLYLNGVISEKSGTVGKIVKTGAGQILIRSNYSSSDATTQTPNTFTGGVEIRKGKVYTYGSTSIYGAGEKHCPLGTGKVIVDKTPETGDVTSFLETCGCVINDIEVLGGTTYANPFVNRGGGAGYNGTITSAGDVYVIGYTTRPDGAEADGKVAFNGPVSIGSAQQPATLYFNGGTWLRLDGAVTCETLDFIQHEGTVNKYYDGMFGGFSLGGTGNAIGVMRLNQGALNCKVNGAANGFALELYGDHASRVVTTARYSDSWPAGKELNTSYVKMLSGSTQTFRWIKSDPRGDDEPNYDFRNGGTAEVTLKIAGEADVTAECSMAIGNNISLVVDAPASFTQVFSNRIHGIRKAITVNSGTLRFAGTAQLGQIDMLTLGTTGRLELTGNQKILEVGNLTVAGVGQESGDYTSVDFPDQIGEGVTIRTLNGVVPEVETTGVWKGGATDDALTTGGNWVGDVAPALDGFGSRLVFALSGVTATAADGQKANSLVFTNQAPVAEEGPSAFTLQGAGAANTRLAVCGGITIGDTLLTTFKDLTVGTTNGRDQGLPTPGGNKTLYVNTLNTSNKTHPLVLNGAVIEKSVCFDTHPNKTTYALKTEANSYNEFKGAVLKNSGNWWTLSISKGSTLVFSGGVSQNWKTSISNSGTLIITNKPWIGTQTANGIMSVNGGKVVLDAEGCTFGWTKAGNQDGLSLSPGSGGSVALEFRRNSAINGSKLRVVVDANNSVNVDFNSTTQQIKGIDWVGPCSDTEDAKRTVFTGASGSLLELTVADSDSVSTNAARITGGLGIRKLGAGTLLLMRSAARRDAGLPNDCTSTGDLSVEEGALELGAGVTWLNGTNFTAKGTGVLKFNAAGQVSHRFADLHLADTGTFYIPDGVTLTVRNIFVSTADGEVAVEKNAAYDGSSEGLMSGRITGGGSVFVRGEGTMMIVK